MPYAARQRYAICRLLEENRYAIVAGLLALSRRSSRRVQPALPTVGLQVYVRLYWWLERRSVNRLSVPQKLVNATMVNEPNRW